MGNRAVVSFENDGEKHGVYLHWNGGPESILAFLQVMEERGWTRADYASARFASVVCEFFDAEGDDSGLSVGIVDDPASWADGCDNGWYRVKRLDTRWSVTRKGKSVATLGEKERKKADGIVETLARVRSARTKAKVSA